jgi:hypothetical protein
VSLQQKATIETTVDKRRQRRHKLLLEVEARGPASLTGAVIVHDISDSGILIETEARLKVGEMIEVNLPQAGLMIAEIMWIGGEIYGCRFTREISPAAVSAARLGGRFTLSISDHSPQEYSATGTLHDAGNALALAGEYSIGAKLWLIIAFAASLWLLIGAVAYWALS